MSELISKAELDALRAERDALSAELNSRDSLADSAAVMAQHLVWIRDGEVDGTPQQIAADGLSDYPAGADYLKLLLQRVAELEATVADWRAGAAVRLDQIEALCAHLTAARASEVRMAEAVAEAVAGSPNDIRALGWSLAVHNDYRLNGVPYTFWLFTKDGQAVKGEGISDVEALNLVRRQVIHAPPAAGLPSSDEE